MTARLPSRPLTGALVLALGGFVALSGCGCAVTHAPPALNNGSNEGPAAPVPGESKLNPVDKEPPPSDGKAGRLHTPTREGVAVNGTKMLRGRSTVLVNAPLDKVRTAVLDVDHYAEFMPHYRSARVLGRKPDGSRELYMQVAALGGALRMWARVTMAKTESAGIETYETQFVDGNVREFKAIWVLKPLDEHRTSLTLEVFLHPKLPMPLKFLNGENLDGAVKGVSAMRDRAEQ